MRSSVEVLGKCLLSQFDLLEPLSAESKHVELELAPTFTGRSSYDSIRRVREERNLSSLGEPRLIASAYRSCCRSSVLRNDIRHDISMHIRQTEVTASVAVGQFQVIQPQQVQDGGVEVVEVDLVLHRVVTIVVGGPVP
jgi:hypothetical protein